MQLAVGQKQVAACTPALENTGAQRCRLVVEDSVHQRHELRVLLAQGETEPDGFMLAEIGNAQARQVAAIELVVGGDGIADEHVGLAKRNGVQGLGRGTEGQQLGLGVDNGDLLFWQVMVEHAQPHVLQAHVQRPAFVFTGDKHRLVNGIGVRQCQAGCCGFIAIGTAEQVDVAAFECLHRRLSAGKTQHPYR
ncbi:hypothetical protein D3C81_821670 [compost metagenome]